MPDDAQGLGETRVIGMEDYRAAKLRALETLVVELLKREGDKAWLERLAEETHALALQPSWVALWRSAQLQVLGRILGQTQQRLVEDDLGEHDDGEPEPGED